MDARNSGRHLTGVTAEAFREVELPIVGRVRIYRTGDVARYLPDGTIDLLGRVDRQVKLRGQRIELGEIERVLSEHPAVREAAAVVHRLEGSGSPQLVAFAAAGASADELQRHLAERLPEVMVPQVVEVMEALPHGPTGKIDRNALPAQAPPTPSPEPADSALPTSDAERVLARIWAEVLGVESVGVTDNFFELGGDSILSIRIIARAHEAGLTLTPRQFFETPTVAELAASLE